MSNLVVRENIIYKKRDYGGLLVNPECGEKTFLNATAFRILQLFDGSNTVEDIIQQLSEEWEVDTEELRGDITEIVTDFQELGVLVAYTGEPPVQYTGAVLDSAAVEVTSRCNLCCKHCIRASPHEETELDFDVICDVIHQLACMQVFDLTLRGGEPFLRPDFCDILAYAQKRMLCTVFTNGTLMTDEHIQRLQEIQPHLVKVMLDGATPETHNAIRDQETFKKTVKTIKKLVEAELPVEISTILSKFNFHEYTSIINFVKNLGVDAIEISEMVPLGRASKFKEFCLSLDETTQFKKYYYEKAIEETDIKIGGILSLDFLKNPFVSGKESIDQDLCPAFRDSLVIKADGAVVPCLSFDEHEFCMGSILDQSVSDIWNSPEYESLRSVSVADCQVCSDCIYRRVCGGGCRAKAFRISGDLKGPPDHVECESKKALYDSSLNKWKPGATVEEFYQLIDNMKKS